MGRIGAKTREIPPVQRGQVIQRILVDGWSPEEAAASLGIAERQVVRWVAAYRQRGMASLRGEVAAEQAPRRWARRLRVMLVRNVARMRGGFGFVEPAPC